MSIGFAVRLCVRPYRIKNVNKKNIWYRQTRQPSSKYKYNAKDTNNKLNQEPERRATFNPNPTLVIKAKKAILLKRRTKQTQLQRIMMSTRPALARQFMAVFSVLLAIALACSTAAQAYSVVDRASAEAAETATAAAAFSCTSDLNCSLNGVCTPQGTCECVRPWRGTQCETLGFAAQTPSTGASLYPLSDPHNTWNGPIARSANDGLYHLYLPLYNPGSLGGPPRVMHGTANNITGPYEWRSQQDICTNCGENPAHVAFKNASNGNKLTHTIWVGGRIYVSESAYGPFVQLQNTR